jgi:Nucleotidyl transferase AbiEii toxin, Type IV TA system
VSRPRGAKEFQRLHQGHAAAIGQPPRRVLHLVRVAVVCGMVDSVRHADGGHLFVVKGGTAMQLRLGIQARATTDLDVVFRGGSMTGSTDSMKPQRALSGTASPSPERSHRRS